MIDKRETFSRFGALMAMAGSAVGLGNIWRFPYLVGQNGGGAFILIYILCALVLAMPIFLSETIIGRRGGANCVGCFRKLAPGTKWYFGGIIAIITPLVIVSYYCVIGGWSIHYLMRALAFDFSTAEGQAQISEIFSSMNSRVWPSVAGFFVFLGISCTIISLGVKSGIEKFGKVVMPILFVIVILIAVYVAFLPGSSKGYAYLFIPDFSKITPRVFADALGQAFYSLSVGCGCIMTFASYMNRKDNILVHSVNTSVIDLCFAIIAGCAIMPAVFSFGMNPGSGPSLVYETLPFIFSQMPGGNLIAIIFFIALLFAALTSAISMIEAMVAFLVESFGLSRRRACTIIFIVSFIIGMLCVLSFSSLSGFKLFGLTIFDMMDKLSSNILMTAGAFITVVFTGWVLKKSDIHDEFTSGGQHKVNERFFGVAYFLIRYVAPVTVLVIFLLNFW